ncbi:MAG: hypothetical protein ACTS73_04795 [Arsenophonus sp. NEOnobi-MAG3]
MLPLIVIKRIEVIRDLISSIYDSYAMSAVINIITRKIGKTLNASLRADITIPEPSNLCNRRQGGFYLADPLIDGMLGMKENALYSCSNEDKFIASYKKYLISNAGITFSFTPNKHNNFNLNFKNNEQQHDSTIGKTCAFTKRSSEDDNITYRHNNYALTNNGNY